ncbi:MAG: hypothetical protein DMF82_12155 [Acidobacteria bacterium]|nr:MAG: hypothetical protein DMF82_12155 [Acidobacteriota bacterium]
MQATCPQCSNRINFDDARAPERPFSVKCPKCQSPVRFPGRTPAAAAAAAPGAPAPAPAAPAATPPPAAAPSRPSAPVGTEALAQLRREVGASESSRGAPTPVLVAVPDNAVAGALTLPLTRLGHTIEMLDTPEEGGRLLEQGAYGIVITTRNAAVPGKSETLYQRVCRLNPDARRRIFMILVGEDLKTGDGTQAFVLQADFVVNPRDAAATEGSLLNSMAERNRVYQAFLDARKRMEAASGY